MRLTRVIFLLVLSTGSFSHAAQPPTNDAAAPSVIAARPDMQLVKPRPLPPEDQKNFDTCVRPFLQTYCFKCHGEKVRKAGLRLDELGTDFLMGKNADTWKEVIDNINIGKMPPKKENTLRPPPAESFPVVEWVGRQLKRAEREAGMAGGHMLIRRLNRFEYANTVRDLFQFDEQAAPRIADYLPTDGVADGFDRVSSALFFDQTQMRRYLEVARQVAGKAIDADPPPKVEILHFEGLKKSKAPPREFEYGVRTNYPKEVDGKKIPFGPAGYVLTDKGVEITAIPGYSPVFINANHPYFLGGGNLNFQVKEDGYYRIRFRGGADKGERGEPVRVTFEAYTFLPTGDRLEAHELITVDAPLNQPRDYERIVYLRKPQGEDKLGFRMSCNLVKDLIVSNPDWQKLLTTINDLRNNQITKAIDGHRPESEVLALREKAAKAVREFADFKDQKWVFNSNLDYAKAPRLLFTSLDIEGPIVSQWPPPSYKQILFDGDQRHDEAYVRAIFERFLPRAFRRPPEKAEVDRFVRMVMNSMKEYDLSFVEAMQLGVKAVLCSPAFLYIHEPSVSDAPRALNDYELASRLSYFLWSSMPDDQLFEQARNGKLHDPGVLKVEVARMVRDPKSRRFVENFAGQWLQVRNFGSVAPGREYNKYYDDTLLAASKEEVYAFFSYVLENDLPISNFLDSDFLVINERLAKHYGIDGVSGEEFRKVAIAPENHRGGILGMAGLLTLLSDGTRTLPVRRGAWTLDHLFNDPPPPPPPNAGEIQPATGDAKTVRQRLERHRNEPTCASCHVKIDPPGLALENYDAIGRWRTKSNGERYGDSGPPIDVSGTLPSGRTFSDLAGYKQALLADKDRFAHALTEKMLTYALGRSVGYVDRAAVDEIQHKVQSDAYHIQTLIQAVVASDVFRTK